MSGVSQEASVDIQSINPATGEVLERFQQITAGEIDKTLDSAYAAFLDWRHRPFTERAERMRNAARILRAGQEKYARTMALEMGKPMEFIPFGSPKGRELLAEMRKTGKERR